MLKFLRVVVVRIVMAPVSGLWVMSLEGFSKHTSPLKTMLMSTEARVREEGAVVRNYTVHKRKNSSIYTKRARVCAHARTRAFSGVTQRTR